MRKRGATNTIRRCEPQRQPALCISVHQNAGDFLIDADQFVANPVRAINATKQPIELIVGDRLLKFLERFPIRRIGQRMAQMIGGADGNALEEGDEEEDSKARDHRLDFRLFNTMLARC